MVETPRIFLVHFFLIYLLSASLSVNTAISANARVARSGITVSVPKAGTAYTVSTRWRIVMARVSTFAFTEASVLRIASPTNTPATAPRPTNIASEAFYLLVFLANKQPTPFAQNWRAIQFPENPCHFAITAGPAKNWSPKTRGKLLLFSFHNFTFTSYHSHLAFSASINRSIDYHQ